MAHPRAHLLALLSAVLLTGSVAACGSSARGDQAGPKTPTSPTASPTPTTPAFAREPGGSIVMASLNAMDFVGQVRLSGRLIVDGEPIEMDVRNDSKGNCSGTVKQGDLITRFVSTHDASYVKGNAEFWRQSVGSDAARVIAHLHGRWAKGKASEEFSRTCRTRLLLSGAKYRTSAEILGPHPTVSAIQQFHGHEVVEVAGRVGKERYRIFVEVEAPHRIFRLNSDTSGDSGELAFEFDDDALVVVPDPEDYVSFRD